MHASRRRRREAAVTPDLLAEIPTVDRALRDHATALGADFTGYRNHVYRVANLCVALAPAGMDQIEKIAVAAAFHDLGIWTDKTFDYLEPSVRLARRHLDNADRPEWIGEIERMIREHHKLTASSADIGRLVEPFRRADWIDVSRGALRFGLSASVVKSILSAWPNAGFHKRLVHLSLKRLWTNPLTPLPMLRL